ncbi:hypothetical protein C9426_34610, partial [Serratia sp. S1B]
VRQSDTDEGILTRRDVRNSPGGFHHGSGHNKTQKETGYMAAIPVHFFQENTCIIRSVHICLAE